MPIRTPFVNVVYIVCCFSVSCRTPPMATTTCEPPRTTKAALPLALPCTTLTTAPPQGHQGELHHLAAVPVAREPQPVEESLFHQAPWPPLDVRRPAMTPDPPPDSLTSATPSLTPSLVEARASSLRPTLPRQPATSPETAACWTPIHSWPTTITDTHRITRPTGWVLPHPVWPHWKPAHPMRCMGWDLVLQALGLGALWLGALGLEWVPRVLLLHQRQD